jgi:drug/metabolite transporter (DMT)-like permease
MRGYVALLLLLAAIWGASFMFIKIAVDELAPTTTMAARLVFSALPLLAYVCYKRGFRPAWTEMRSIVRAAMVLGIISTALPFTLIAWGETKIDSGVAAIGNASMPIFVAILAFRFRRSERATGSKAVGVVLGLIGVGVLTGVNPEGGWAGVAGTLAVILASISYAISTLYIQGLLDNVHNDVLAAASVTWGAIFLTPIGIAEAPSHFPSWGVVGSILALALLGTVAGQLLYFSLVYRYGSARASLVVYLLPVTALFYGALLLDEPMTASALAGLVLILTGTALGSGLLRMPRRRAPVPAAP